MKTFFNLVQEVQKPGLCHHCGGCVTFCTAINFGALEIDDDGKPQYSDMEKCIECGICYMICPEIDELNEEAKRKISWSAPMGRVLETTVARSTDSDILKRATDGGAVTGILTHLFETGRIDGAIVTRQVGLFNREPCLATTREEIMGAAGFHFDASHGMNLFSEQYSTYSPNIQMLGQMNKRRDSRIAFVGTPCQVKTIRKMETQGIVPTDSIKYTLGLFCSGNFIFGPQQQKKLEKMAEFKWDDVQKINVKDGLRIHLKNKDVKQIPLENLEFMRRYACRFCDDYAAEYADISFGGVSAEEGWTTVITRTPLGRAVYAWARGDKALEQYSTERDPKFATQAMKTVLHWSQEKKNTAAINRDTLEVKPVEVKS